MRVEMIMPQMGESIAEATVLKWLKAVGDKVKKDETILEISTDKVDSEIPSPAEGVLAEIVAAEGDTVDVKTIIAYIETDASVEVDSASNGAPKAAAPAKEDAPAKEATPAAAPSPAPTPAPSAPAAPAAPAMSTSAAPQSDGQAASGIPNTIGDRFYSPLVRSIASQHGISPVELSAIPGSGENGRVTKKDVMLYLQHRGTAPAQVSGAPAAAAPAPSARAPQMPPAPPALDYGPDGTRVEKMDRMRKLIADHMVRSKATSPHVYSVAEVDVTNIVKCRERNKAEFQAREGFKLSVTPFFLEAAVRALVQFPQVNCSVDGDSIILKRDINLGCAVAIGTTGLIVPVIKKADQLNLVGIARSLNDLAQRARSKKLQPDDTSGGTFTVTNPGIFGNTIGMPIINQPQVAILALCAIKKRPVVVDNAIAIRDMINLTLSYDHRVVDGSLSGHFLSFMTDYLENWDPNQKIV